MGSGCRGRAGDAALRLAKSKGKKLGTSTCRGGCCTGRHAPRRSRLVAGRLTATGHRRWHGLSSPLKLLHFRLLSPGFLFPRLPRASIQPTPVPQRTPAVLLRAQGRIINLGNPPMAANVADRNPHHPPSHACNYRFDPRSENPSSLEESTLHYALRLFYR